MKEYSQEKNTWAFVREYEVLKALEANDAEEDYEAVENSAENDAVLIEKVKKLVSPFNLNIQPGQIRLLSQTDKLTYAVVLPWSWSHILLVPFSHCENPATDKELYSDGKARGLFQQVFQIWNARTVNRAVLAKSWVLGQVSQTDMERINKMLKHDWLGDELPEDIRDMTGLPLLEGYDIRRKFMHNELANFAKLDAQDAAIDLNTEELFSSETTKRFSVLAEKVEAVLLAAASNSNFSEAYIFRESGIEFLQGIELTDFEPVEENSPLPGFCWLTKALPEECTSGTTVFFRHKPTGKWLGCGFLNQKKYGWEIILASKIDQEEVPVITEAADIQLIFNVRTGK